MGRHGGGGLDEQDHHPLCDMRSDLVNNIPPLGIATHSLPDFKHTLIHK